MNKQSRESMKYSLMIEVKITKGWQPILKFTKTKKRHEPGTSKTGGKISCRLSNHSKSELHGLRELTGLIDVFHRSLSLSP